MDVDKPSTVSLTTGANTAPQHIKRLNPDVANEGLGSFSTPSGSQAAEMKHRCRQCDVIATRLSMCTFTFQEAWTLWTTISVPKVFHSCSMTACKPSDWSHTTSSLVTAILPKVKYNRTMEQRIVFGPRQRGGIGLCHRYSHQGADDTC